MNSIDDANCIQGRSSSPDLKDQGESVGNPVGKGLPRAVRALRFAPNAENEDTPPSDFKQDGVVETDTPHEISHISNNQALPQETPHIPENNNNFSFFDDAFQLAFEPEEP